MNVERQFAHSFTIYVGLAQARTNKQIAHTCTVYVGLAHLVLHLYLCLYRLDVCIYVHASYFVHSILHRITDDTAIKDNPDYPPHGGSTGWGGLSTLSAINFRPIGGALAHACTECQCNCLVIATHLHNTG